VTLARPTIRRGYILVGVLRGALRQPVFTVANGSVVDLERLERSVELLKASAAIFLQHRGLLVFPLLSMLALMLLVASFALPLGGVHALEVLNSHNSRLLFPQYMAAFLFYFCQYFVIFFFNTALVGAVMMQVDGDTPSVGDGLRIALSRIYALLGYAFIAATVGMLLHLIQERVGFVGRFIVGLLGVAWTLATYLVVPVLAWSQCGPIEAITQSAELFKRTWGETGIGVGGMGLAFALIFISLFACGVVLIGFTSHVLHSALLTIVVQIVLVGAFVLTAFINATLTGIYKVALFRYANGFSNIAGFDSGVLEQAFQRAD
jgi:hypothetical protein